ncbi:DUF1629 domain-containing protein [Photobacterium damselae]
MAIKIWTNKVDIDSDYTEGKVRDPILLQGLKLAGGFPIDGLWPKVVIDVTSDYKPADSFLSGPMLIVNHKLAALLCEFVSKEEIELLPVEVIYQGEPYKEYYFLNVLVICDALDRRNSEFTELDGMIDSIDRVAFNEEKAKDKRLFLLDSIEWLLCVSDELVSRIESIGFSGIAFKSEADWRPF